MDSSEGGMCRGSRARGGMAMDPVAEHGVLDNSTGGQEFGALKAESSGCSGMVF